MCTTWAMGRVSIAQSQVSSSPAWIAICESLKHMCHALGITLCALEGSLHPFPDSQGPDRKSPWEMEAFDLSCLLQIHCRMRQAHQHRHLWRAGDFEKQKECEILCFNRGLSLSADKLPAIRKTPHSILILGKVGGEVWTPLRHWSWCPSSQHFVLVIAQSAVLKLEHSQIWAIELKGWGQLKLSEM